MSFYYSHITLRLIGSKRKKVFAREKFNDDYVKATAASLLLSNVAGCYEIVIIEKM